MAAVLSARRSKTVWVALAIVVIVGATVLTMKSRAFSSQNFVELPQPQGWVPFSADVQVSQPGQPLVVGHFYRSSDGSTRLETGPGDERVVVSIRNIKRVTFFVKNPKGEWISRPMKMRPGVYMPGRMKATTAGLFNYPFRLALREGESGSLRADSGMKAYQYINPSGNVSLLAPELNFFAVLQVTLDGRSEQYSQIKMGEPDASLFEPPPGVQVTARSEPGGIVEHSPQSAFHRLPRARAQHHE